LPVVVGADTNPNTAARATRQRWAVPPAVWFGLIVVLAAVLRIAWLGHLNFRNDESFSLLYSRQSWAGVLGFDGFYDFHPPLSFALAKLAAIFVPEVLASRTVAAIFGVATVPILYALTRRLIDARAALVASLVFAVSPAHIEFSRIGRMYAPVTFAIACAWLALVAYFEDGRRRWALLYGVALTLAMYLDYSSLYGLVPQIPLIALIVRRWRRASLWMIAAVLGAFVAYLPWVTQLPGTVRLANEYSRRATYLAASWANIDAAWPGVIGLSGGGAGGGADWPNVWFRWPDARWILVALLVPLVVAATAAFRRFPIAALVAGGLLIGTPLVAIAASQVSAGFALRTIIPATLGWSIVAGAAFARITMPRVLRGTAVLSCAVLLMVNVNALPATYSNKDRVLRIDLASHTMADVEPLGKPILTFSTGGLDTDVIEAFTGDSLANARIITFVDGRLEAASAMSRWETRGPSRIQVKNGELSQYFNPNDPGNDAFWFFTHRVPTDFHEAFRELGYDRRLHLDFAKVVIELWALPGANLGSEIEINGSFAGSQGAQGWHASEAIAFHRSGGLTTAAFPAQPDRLRLVRTIPNVSAGLYSLDVGVMQGTDATPIVRMKCQSTSGDVLAAYRETIPAIENGAAAPAEGTLRVSALCPNGTAALVIELESDGRGPVEYRDAHLFGFPLRSVGHLMRDT
jgi:hypothetical protein